MQADTAFNALLVHCILERLASRKLDSLRRGDLECFTGLRVATRTGRTRARAERSKADELNWIALDHRVRHGRQKCVVVSAAADFVMPASLATASMRSCLFMLMLSM